MLLDKGIPKERLYGLRTDGAAIMTGNYMKPCESILAVESLNIVTKCVFFYLGRVNGVEKQLTDSFPKLVTMACAAHRLALACKDASNDVKYMATFRNHLQDLYLYFRNSANRTATLKAASITLGVSDLKLKVILF